jgi:hypothetical protein
MLDVIRWTICLLLGVPSFLLILGNWAIVIGAAVEAAKRGKSRTFSFAPPFLCGIAGAIASFVCPIPEVRRWAWLPPLVDPSIAIMLVSVILHIVARIIGKPSPFDRSPSDESDPNSTPPAEVDHGNDSL